VPDGDWCDLQTIVMFWASCAVTVMTAVSVMTARHVGGVTIVAVEEKCLKFTTKSRRRRSPAVVDEPRRGSKTRRTARCDQEEQSQAFARGHRWRAEYDFRSAWAPSRCAETLSITRLCFRPRSIRPLRFAMLRRGTAAYRSVTARTDEARGTLLGPAVHQRSTAAHPLGLAMHRRSTRVPLRHGGAR